MKKIFLSILVAAFVGLFLGLILSSFIPICCIDDNCRSCLKIFNIYGYQAAAYLGFCLGAIIGLVMFILKIKKKNNFF